MAAEQMSLSSTSFSRVYACFPGVPDEF
jgi:hypothetical protein